jgi:uncharacterized cupredoxin-like copper-binding protein
MKTHAVEMKKLAGQSTGHADEHPNGAGNELIELNVNPGETKEWVIRFDKAQTLQMACLIPGHFEAGMKGQVVVQDKGSTAQSIQTTKPEKKSNNAHDHSSHKH